MVTLDGKPVRALLDGGAQCCAVLKTLVPPLPEDVPTLRNYRIHGSGNNPLTRATISASGLTHDVEALVNDELPADFIISLNYPSFTKLWNEVEPQKVGINAVFTRQQAQHEVEEESSAEVINESKSTPLSEIPRRCL